MKLPVSTYINGTVVDIEYPFREDNGKTKHRPAVVMSYDKDMTYVALLQVTTHAPRSKYDKEVKQMNNVLTQQDKKDAILEKVSIMIDIMMDLLDKPYSDCYALIINSQTYKLLTMGDVGALHDSPQANLIDIGEELKNRGLIESNQLTEFAIKEHAKKMVSLS